VTMALIPGQQRYRRNIVYAASFRLCVLILRFNNEISCFNYIS